VSQAFQNPNDQIEDVTLIIDREYRAHGLEFVRLGRVPLRQDDCQSLRTGGARAWRAADAITGARTPHTWGP
jgi:hypothetical protein